MVLVLRLLVGGLLAVTAVGKGLDLQGFARVVGTYQVLPAPLWMPVAVFMTGVEGGLAVWLFAGRRLAQAGWAAAALHLGFLSWAGLALARGLEIPNCGCFGVFWARPLTLGTLVEDAVMVTVCVLLAGLARSPGAPHHQESSEAV